MLVDQIAVEHASDADRHLEGRQLLDAVGLVGQVAQIEALQDALGQLLTQLAAVVFIEPQWSPNGEVLVTLRELADLTARKYDALRGLKVTLYNKAAVLHQAVFVDDIEYLAVDVYQARGDEIAGVQLHLIKQLAL